MQADFRFELSIYIKKMQIIDCMRMTYMVVTRPQTTYI